MVRLKSLLFWRKKRQKIRIRYKNGMIIGIKKPIAYNYKQVASDNKIAKQWHQASMTGILLSSIRLYAQ